MSARLCDTSLASTLSIRSLSAYMSGLKVTILSIELPTAFHTLSMSVYMLTIGSTLNLFELIYALKYVCFNLLTLLIRWIELLKVGMRGNSLVWTLVLSTLKILSWHQRNNFQVIFFWAIFLIFYLNLLTLFWTDSELINVFFLLLLRLYESMKSINTFTWAYCERITDSPKYSSNSPKNFKHVQN